MRERLDVWKTAGRRLAAAVFMAAAAGMTAGGASANGTHSPQTAGALAAAADGTVYKLFASKLQRSGDGGATWVPVAADLPDLRLLAVPADTANVIVLGGKDSEVVRYDLNTGKSQTIGHGLPKGEVSALAAHTTQPDTLYAVIAEDGIWRTRDAGKTWQRMDKRTANARRLIHTDLEGSMESGWLYAITPDKIRFSMDCFCLWRNGGTIPGAPIAIAFDPSKPALMYASSTTGFFRSEDGGQTWVPASAPADGITDIAVTGSGTVFALTPEGSVLRSADKGATWGTGE